jgi:hypothetical protein
MTIKALYPTIEPTLNLDFANTKRLDPRITFSRASTGTYFDENGTLRTAATNAARFDHNPATGESLGLLVEEARTNLAHPTAIPRTDAGVFAIDGASIQTNAALAPDGTFTASLMDFSKGTGNNRFYFFTGGVLRDEAYSFYIKRGSAGSVFAFQTVGAMTSIDGYFNFDTQVLTGTNSNLITVTSVSNGWYKLSFTATISSTVGSSAYIQVRPLASGTGSFYIWGWQREAASFPTSYIPTPATFTGRTSTATFYNASGVVQTAASGVARSDAYFPDSSGIMRSAGLLLESAGTNLIVGSQAFNAGGWNQDGASLTLNAAAAPDGTVTATSIVQGTANNRIYQFDNNGAGNKTFTIFAKSNAGSSLVLTGGMAYGTNLVSTATLNTADGTISGATGCSSIKLANGWYRFILPVFVGTGSGNTNYYTINGPASSVYIWGAQVETSPYATSYIPTVASTVTRSADTSTSATVTRSADVAQITGTNFSSWFNPTVGTFFTDSSNDQLTSNIARSAYNQSNTVAFSLGSGSGRVYTPILSYLSNNTIYASLFQYNGGSTEWGPALQNTIPNTANVGKVAVFTDTTSNVAGLCTVGQINVANKPVDPTRTGELSYSLAQSMVIGYNSNYYGNYIGRIKRIAYWPVRLSNAILQASTIA